MRVVHIRVFRRLIFFFRQIACAYSWLRTAESQRILSDDHADRATGTRVEADFNSLQYAASFLLTHLTHALTHQAVKCVVAEPRRHRRWHRNLWVYFRAVRARAAVPAPGRDPCVLFCVFLWFSIGKCSICPLLFFAF